MSTFTFYTLSFVQWIYNILEKKKESEFIVYEDPDPETGYILIPDLKWDKKSLDTMYLSAITHKYVNTLWLFYSMYRVHEVLCFD